MSRCKPGDLAMITHDVPSCSANIGRVVVISGPPELDWQGQLTWLIQPVTDEPYMINDRESNFVGFMGFQEYGIEHRDAWMVPIRQSDLKALVTGSEEVLVTGLDEEVAVRKH